jgi:methyl-accepting chemotaxis protein
MIGSVAMAMSEQATALTQISAATENIRRQTDQTNKGMAEQSRAAADLTTATRNVATQIVLITRANQDQSEATESLAKSIAEARGVGLTAAQGAKDAGALTQQLVERARSLGQYSATN